MEAERRLHNIEKERDSLLLEITKKKGSTILFTQDPRYSTLHEDLDSDVIAEGKILVGPPHLLTFTYDSMNPSYVRRMVPVPQSKMNAFVGDEMEDMTDSDDSSSSSSDDVSPSQSSTVEGERMAIASDSVRYPIDMPHYAKKGKRYDFFVLAPTE